MHSVPVIMMLAKNFTKISDFDLDLRIKIKTLICSCNQSRTGVQPYKLAPTTLAHFLSRSHHAAQCD